MRLVKVLETKDKDFFTDFLFALTLKWTHDSALELFGAWIILGQVWETCSDLFNIHLHVQILLISIPSKLNSLNPWKHQMSKSSLCCFSVSLPGNSTLRRLLILSFSTTSAPKPHHLENFTSRAAHACQLEATCPVGRVGKLEEQRCMKYSQTKSHAIPFHLQKENSYGKNMQGIEHFQRNCYSS